MNRGKYSVLEQALEHILSPAPCGKPAVETFLPLLRHHVQPVEPVHAWTQANMNGHGSCNNAQPPIKVH